MPRKPMPESEKKVLLTVRVKPDVKDAIQALAEADERPIAYFVEKALREWLDRRKRK